LQVFAGIGSGLLCAGKKRSYIYNQLKFMKNFKKMILQIVQSEHWFAFVKRFDPFFAKLQICGAGHTVNIYVD